jgi:hypothetical protein
MGCALIFVLSFVTLYYQLCTNDSYSAIYFVWILSNMVFCSSVNVEAAEALFVFLPVSLNAGLAVMYLGNKL